MNVIPNRRKFNQILVLAEKNIRFNLPTNIDLVNRWVISLLQAANIVLNNWIFKDKKPIKILEGNSKEFFPGKYRIELTENDILKFYKLLSMYLLDVFLRNESHVKLLNAIGSSAIQFKALVQKTLQYNEQEKELSNNLEMLGDKDAIDQSLALYHSFREVLFHIDNTDVNRIISGANPFDVMLFRRAYLFTAYQIFINIFSNSLASYK